MGQSSAWEGNRSLQEYPLPSQSLNWAWWIKSTPCQPISLRSTLIWSSHRACLPNSFIPSGFPHKPLHAFPFPVMHATCLAHLTFLDFITLMFGEVYKSWGSSLRNFLPLSSKYVSQHPVFEPQSMSFHPCERPSFTHIKPRQKVTVFYTLLFMVFGSRWKGKIFWKEWW